MLGLSIPRPLDMYLKKMNKVSSHFWRIEPRTFGLDLICIRNIEEEKKKVSFWEDRTQYFWISSPTRYARADNAKILGSIFLGAKYFLFISYKKNIVRPSRGSIPGASNLFMLYKKGDWYLSVCRNILKKVFLHKYSHSVGFKPTLPKQSLFYGRKLH